MKSLAFIAIGACLSLYVSVGLTHAEIINASGFTSAFGSVTVEGQKPKSNGEFSSYFGATGFAVADQGLFPSDWPRGGRSFHVPFPHSVGLIQAEQVLILDDFGSSVSSGESIFTNGYVANLSFHLSNPFYVDGVPYWDFPRYRTPITSETEFEGSYTFISDMPGKVRISWGASLNQSAPFPLPDGQNKILSRSFCKSA
jgi:hypothetical protein